LIKTTESNAVCGCFKHSHSMAAVLKNRSPYHSPQQLNVSLQNLAKNFRNAHGKETVLVTKASAYRPAYSDINVV